MRRTNSTSDERAQAFTLEGFISAIVILTAVLFALQAVVITPTTGGAVDRAAQAQEEREVQDALIVAAEKGELSKLVRNWNMSSEEVRWERSSGRPDAAYNNSEFANISEFGEILNQQFVNAGGKSYNLEFIGYSGAEKRQTETIVRMGGGTGDAVISASYFVTVYEDDRLTKADGSQGFTDKTDTVEDAGDPSLNADQRYPFPNNPDSSRVYSVIEVRVTVW